MEKDYWESLITLLCYLAYAWCAAGFFGMHLHGKQSEKGVFCGLLFCAYGIIALPFKRMGMPYIICASVSHLLLIVLSLTIFKGEKEKKLLAAVVLTAITRLVWNFCESFLSVVWLLTFHHGTGGWQNEAICLNGAGLITFAAFTVGLIAVRVLSKSFIPVFADKQKSWYLFLSVPLAGIVMIMDLAVWAASNGIMVHDWGKYGLYENQLFSHGAMCIFIGLAMAASGFFTFGMDKIDREEKAREQYRFQVSYYQMIEEQYSQMERLRHDMKNHMIVLGNLVKSGQWDVAGDYLKEMERAGNMAGGDEATGSFVMDALLQDKRHLAAEKGIRWQCDGKFLNDLPVKEIDLCIIVGNILDNALEACSRLMENRAEPEKQKETENQKKLENQEEPYIHVYMGKAKQCLLLEVRNSMDDGDSRKTGRKQTEKTGRHGLGLLNVQAAAAKYNGAVHTETEKGRFTISVLLPLYRDNSLGEGQHG